MSPFGTMSIAFTATVFALCWLQPLSTTASESTAPIAIAQWIDQLNDDSYVVRELATERLLEAGYNARKQLEKVAQSPDPEIRARASRLLVLILECDFRRRLEAFVQDTEGELGLSLPGWDEFQKVADSSSVSRALFVEMQQHQAELLRLAFEMSDQTRLELQLSESMTKLSQWQQLQRKYRGSSDGTTHPPLGSCAAVLFVASHYGQSISDVISNQLLQLLRQESLKSALNSGNFQPQFRQLLLQWILQGKEVAHNSIDQKLGLIVSLSLKDAEPYVLEVIGRKLPHHGMGHPHHAKAMMALLAIDPDFDITVIEPFLTDKSHCGYVRGQKKKQNRAVNYLVEIRDVALGVLVVRTGQKIADYHFYRGRLDNKWYQKLTPVGFQSAEARTSAFERWENWRASE